MTDPRLAELTQLAHANTMLMDDGIRHGIHLARFQAGEAQRITAFLRKHVVPDIMRSINSELDDLLGGPLDSLRLQRLMRVMSEVGGIVRAGMNDARARVEGTLNELVQSEADFVVNSLTRASPIQLQLQAPSNTLLKRIILDDVRGAPMRDWFTRLGRDTSQKVERALRVGIAQGESRRQVSRRVRSVLNVSQHHAATITRTSISQVSAGAREEAYSANDDVIKGVRYVATLDSRTTEVCGSLDGRVFDINDGPRPPMHHNCRSTTVPVLKSWKELGFDLKELSAPERASMNGQVPSTPTFPSWLKKQSNSVQAENLGVAKAAAFRKGTYTFNKYSDVSPQPSPLTFKQLLEKDSSIFS